MRAFADALDSVPMALAENSGLSPIETLANIKSRQAKEGNTRLGVDCMQTGSNGECTVSYLLHLFHTLSIFVRVSLSSVSDRHDQHILFLGTAAVLSCTPKALLRNRVVARSLGDDLYPRSRDVAPCPPRNTNGLRYSTLQPQVEIGWITKSNLALLSPASPASLDTFVIKPTRIRANVAFSQI
jgi:hypothetical protein